MPASVKHLNELLADKQKASKTSVFAKWPSDRLFYPVSLIKLDHTNRKATVRFEDDTQFDSDLSELHLQLNDANIYDDIEDVICCACDGGESAKQNEIVICEVCQQGYHQKCHVPKISNTILQPSHSDEDWICGTCEYMMVQLKASVPGGYSSTPTVKKPKKTKETGKHQFKAPKPPRVKLPTASKVEVKPVNGEPPKNTDTDMLPVLDSDNSSDNSLAGHIEKLTTGTPASVNTVPNQAAKIANACLEREEEPKTKTPDLVDAIAENKALELHAVEQQMAALPDKEQPQAIMAAEDKEADELVSTEAVAKAKATKPAAKKAPVKKVTGGRAPRKYVARPA